MKSNTLFVLLVLTATTACVAAPASAPATTPSPTGFWARQLGDNSREYATALAVDRAGNVYVGGYFLGHTELAEGMRLTSAGDADAFVAKLDPAGRPLWARRFGGLWQDEARGLAIGDGGEVYVTGFFTGSAHSGAGGPKLTSAGGADVFLLRFDPDGTPRWGKAMGGELADNGVAVAAGADAVFVTGSFQKVADLDPGPGERLLTSAGAGDAFVARLSAAGGLVWAERMGGERNDLGRAIVFDPSGDGGVAVAGSFSGRMPAPGASGTVLESAGGADVFVTRLSAAGEPGWSRRFGGPAADSVEAMAAGDGGDLYLTGQFTTDLEIPTDADPVRLTSRGGLDAFLVRLDAAGRARWARQLGGAGNELAFGVAGDGEGGAWVSGFVLPGGGPSAAVPTETSSYLVRLGETGEPATELELAASSGIQSFALAAGAEGALYLAGAFKGKAEITPRRGPAAHLASRGKVDIFVVKVPPAVP